MSRCTYLKRHQDDGITWYDCTLTELDLECPYPAKQCRFKDQGEDFANWVITVRDGVER